MDRARKRAVTKKVGKRIGERIASLRRSRGISRARLAREADVSLTNLLLIERGQVAATITTLAELARVLRATLVDLLGEEPLPAAKGAGQKTFSRLVDRLSTKSERYLTATTKLLDALDAVTEV